MQKVLNKIFAAILTIILIGINFMPTLSYAVGEIEQNAKTSQENVEFNASINDAYETSINVNEEGKLKLNLKVLGTGYLKDAKVTLKDNNYKLIENEDMEIENGNTIKLNEINAGEVLNLEIPIKVNKEEKVLENEISRESTVTLNATYVNEKGKEKEISKELKLNLTWKAEASEKINQTLIKYIKFGGNKTMLSFKIEEGIENNAIPYNAKKLTVQVPMLNGVKPSNAIVIGDNIKYNYENNEITIEKENAADAEGKINWNSQDTYIITYIYETQDVPASIETNAVAIINVNEQEIKAETTENTYKLKEQIGSFVDIEISGTNELNKGYIYTNLNKADNKLETNFSTTYSANIGYKELVDKVIIKEQNPLLAGKEINAIKTKKVTIDRENLINVLGEDGKIKVSTQDGKEIGKFYQGLTEITTEETNLIFETTKPVQEGTLKINVEKALTDIQGYNRAKLMSIKEMKERATVETYNGENKISAQEETKTINLVEPTSEASIDVNVNNLSTVVTNQDVIITATLKTNSIQTALYENPKVKIILPEEIKSINLKEASLIYEEELVPTRFETIGNNIELDLSGIQTKYASQATSEGTVIRIVADLELDNLATSKQTNVKLAYLNGATNENKEIAKEINIVAPTEFITTNTIEVDGNKLTAQESEKTTKIKANEEQKEATISGTIINNLGIETKGITIVGKISSEEDTSIEVSLKSQVNIEGSNANIYYSKSSNEDINGNGWTKEASEDSKAFKAVLTDNLADKQKVNFNYKVSIPANVGYEKVAKSNYTVYYDNNAQEGNSKNTVTAKAVAMETGVPNPLKIETTIIDEGTKQEIAEGSDIKDGTYAKYKVKITNSGKETIKNVKLVLDYPDEVGLAKIEEDAGIKQFKVDKMTKRFTHNISEIKAGESKEFTDILAIIAGINDDSKKTVTLTSTATGDDVDGESKKTLQINAIKGDIGIIDYIVENELVSGDEFKYNLDIKNPNSDEKNNVQAIITIPEEFELKKVSDDKNYTYDENTHILTYTIPTLKGNASKRLTLTLQVKEQENDKTVKMEAKIKCDEMENEKQSPSVEYKLIAKMVTVTHTSNMTEGKLTDKDKLIYYIEVKNNTSENLVVNIMDKISSNLSVKNYTITDSNGERTIDYTGRTILEKISVEANKTGKIAIETSPYTLEKGKSLDVENTPKITVNDKNIEVRTLKHTVVGSSDHSSGNPDDWNDDNDNNDDLETEDGTYIINGIVWIDKNANGKKDEGEERLSGQTVSVYNNDTGKLALDVNQKELTTKTDNVGRYSFTNVVPGNYIVVIEYDNKVYEITTYKAQDLLESQDSDFIEAKLDGKDVATTNTIAVINSNIYNIDLGLVNRNRFDLKLSKTVNRITVTNTKDNVKTRIYDFDNKSIAKVELANKNIDTATVTIEYSIKVTNEGQVPGYAKSIVDYLPSGMTFNSELNTNWYVGNDGNAYSTSLSNTIINPGETKEIRLVLTRKMNDNNLGTIRNTAEILSSYNELGLEDIDSVAGNKKTGEDDMSSVDTIIGTATGKTTIAVLGITLGILSIIATAVYATKKYVINKIV